jgi:FkbM family methyltransferase
LSFAQIVQIYMTEIPESQPPRLLNTRYGSLSAPIGKNDLVTDFLEHYGEWASLEVDYIASFLPPKARVLDIGAYVGTFSLGLAQTAKTAFIAMVEGNPAIAPHLVLNATRNLHCAHEVMSALVVNSTAPLVETGWAEPDNSGSASFGEKASGVVRVPLPNATIGFKALVERFKPLDLVKFDVEGMEEQLLADHPSLLQDRSVLLWLECNESHSSLSLVQMLLDAGRPVTYFAWPSHNPDNYLGATRKIFPFAFEAGLLLGANPTPLTSQQQRAGCLTKRIHTVEDLREALWLTPRWAPREWDALDRNEIAAIAAHLGLGKMREGFLNKAAATAEGASNPDMNADGRLAAVKDAKIAQLESSLAELVSHNLELERAASPAVVVTKMAVLSEREQLARELSESLREQLAMLLDHTEALSTDLQSIRSSLTWRTALKLSSVGGRIPFLRRIVRHLLRHKIVGVPS